MGHPVFVETFDKFKERKNKKSQNLKRNPKMQ